MAKQTKQKDNVVDVAPEGYTKTTPPKSENVTTVQRLENLLQTRTQLEVSLAKVQGAIEVLTDMVKGEKDGKQSKG